jgi:cytochrome c oxidase assembly protein subunit 15
MNSVDLGHLPDPLARRRLLLQRMAWLCAVMVLLITGLSAFLRLSKAGLDCEPWPQCYAQAQQASAETPVAFAQGAMGTAVARMAHRVIASAALVLVLVMLMAALASRPVLWPEGRMALGLLVLALFLAVLGRWTAQARLPAVTLGNLLGGFAMFALSVRMALVAAAPLSTRPGAAPLAPWAWLAGLLLLAQVALGGLVSAGHAGLSCPTWGDCNVAAGSWQALNPWLEPPSGALPTRPEGAWVHLLHRAGSVLLTAVLWLLAWRSWRLGLGAVALGLAAIPAALAALGLAMVAWDLPLALVLVHNTGSALLLALLWGLTVPRRA